MMTLVGGAKIPWRAQRFLLNFSNYERQKIKF